MTKKINKGMVITIYMDDNSIYYGTVLSTEITIVDDCLDAWVTLEQCNDDSISSEKYGLGTFGLKHIQKISI